MPAFCHQRALAPFENWVSLFHVRVKLILPLGQLRPVTQNLLGRQPAVLRDRSKAQVKVRGFLIHMYHGRKDVTPSHFLLHEGHRFGEIGLYLLLASACKKFRAGGDECVHKHGAVLSEAAPRRLDANVDFLSVLLCGLDDVEIVLAFADVNVRVAGVPLLCALVMGFQGSCRPGLVLDKAKNCVLCFMRHQTPFLHPSIQIP